MMDKLESGYIILENHKGLKAEFSTLGAGVKSLVLDGKPLILSLKDEQTYLSSPQLFGKTVSRFIGRLPSTVEIDGNQYQLEEDSDGICLHGGYQKSMIFRNYESKVYEDDQYVGVIFTGFSQDGDCGFPGNLNVKVTYLLSKDMNLMTIKYEAISDKDTLISLSNHMYWNLCSENVDDYTLKINASKYGTFKENSLLIGGIDDVPYYLDFTTPSLLKEKLDSIEKEIPQIGTLDHSFIFDKVTNLQPQVVLSNKNYKVECFTDFDACNLYVDSTLSEVEFENNPNLIHNKRRGIAIEPQQFVLDHFVLKANQLYSHYITYKISKK